MKASALFLLAMLTAGVQAQPAGRPPAAPERGPAQPAAQAPERLGRLFLTPQQRQELDRRRQLNIVETVVSNEGTLTINGQVSRSGGRTTTWVNGVPENDAYPSADAARVPVETGDSQGRVRLKVGETYDKSRGDVDQGLSGGQVTINRSPGRSR